MTWRPLFTSYSGQNLLPAFLISTDFTPDSYRVYLTDLTYIWGESLSRTAIVQRSQDEGTIIELADEDDEENLQVFLQKIRGALEGQNGTTVDLKVSADGQRRSAIASLMLAITSDVKSLGTLKWSFQMEPVPQHTLTDKLILPLIHAQRVRSTEEASLLQALKEKDHVIQKLVDKLETQGTDLGQVFPGAAGKGGRKVTRVWAEERIKGLGVFNEETWRKGNPIDSSVETKKLVAEIFGTDSTLFPTTHGKFKRENSKNWWEGKERAIRLSTSDETPPGSSITTKSKLNKEESTDDFQVQATPPAKTPRRVVKDIVVDSTDDDDDDLDRLSQPIPDSFPTASPKVKKPALGGLRSSRAVPKSAQPEPGKDTETEGEPMETSPKKAPFKKLPPRKPVHRKAPSLDDDSTESESEVLPVREEGDPKIDSTTRNTRTESKDGSSPARKVAAPVEDVTESEDEVPPPLAETSTGSASQKAVLAEDEETASDSQESLPANYRPPKSFSSELQTKIVQEESETEDELSPPSKNSSRAVTKSPELNAKPMASKLGGLKKKPALSLEDRPVSEDSEQPVKRRLGGLRQKSPSKEAAKPISKLGGLRRKPAMLSSSDEEAQADTPKNLSSLRKQTPVTDVGGSSRGRSAEKIPSPPPRETSEERANKKREQLKRELAEKVAKGPVKKKRKF